MSSTEDPERVEELPIQDSPLPPRFDEVLGQHEHDAPHLPSDGEDGTQQASQKGSGKKKAGWASFLLILAAKAKTILVGAKSLLILLKAGKLLTTSASMLVTMWLYARFFGWPFAVGIVVLIFVHEMGHVFVAWRQGAPISAPIFIPFMGALIVQKRMPNSAWAEAVLGIGGPLGGTVGALLCFAVYGATGSEFFLALAYFGFFINLFNLTPIHPLDGGWIVASISTYLWLAGLAALVTLFALGLIRNPFILVLLIVSIPTMWRGLTHKGEYFPGLAPATRLQKLIMGVSYVGLAGGLLWGMAVCHAAGRFR